MTGQAVGMWEPAPQLLGKKQKVLYVAFEKGTELVHRIQKLGWDLENMDMFHIPPNTEGAWAVSLAIYPSSISSLPSLSSLL
jgi:hypothetical protein